MVQNTYFMMSSNPTKFCICKIPDYCNTPKNKDFTSKGQIFHENSQNPNNSSWMFPTFFSHCINVRNTPPVTSNSSNSAQVNNGPDMICMQFSGLTRFLNFIVPFFWNFWNHFLFTLCLILKIKFTGSPSGNGMEHYAFHSFNLFNLTYPLTYTMPLWQCQCKSERIPSNTSNNNNNK